MSTLFSHYFEKFNQISPLEEDFTEVLESIALTPKILYFYGKIPKKRLKTVAIVGARKPTAYGLEIAYNLARAVVQRGGVVVSGLAYGIDAAAHRGAVEAGGLTIGVLGTPIDKIYPRENQELARQILETGGAVMSEMAPGTIYNAKWSFLERNRIISGLADVVVIVEAAERSGSLNTAAHALEQGREVFAVPGDIHRPLSKGCNRLIRQGAMPFLENKDVLDILFPAPKRSKSKQARLLIGDNEAETAILRQIMAGNDDGAEIVKATGLSVSEFNQNITMLEIKGRVKGSGMNRWMILE